jgi:hypothetical protein
VELVPEMGQELGRLLFKTKEIWIMRGKAHIVLTIVISLILANIAVGATQQQKRAAIDKGLAFLANTQTVVGDEGSWPYSNNGTLAATATVVLAFVEEGYLPGEDVIIDTGSGPVNYGDVVGLAVNYIFNRAQSASAYGWTNHGEETAGYLRYAEDYNSNGNPSDDGGNDQAIWFNPGNYDRSIYTTGIVAPTVYALGEILGRDTVINRGSAVVASLTYKQLMQDIVDWFSWAQVEPDRGNFRGGWRYAPNYATSDNSTAQWGALPLLYGQTWGLGTPAHVYAELDLWVHHVQNPNGGSGYTYAYDIVNVAKTGGLLLELAAIGYEVGDPEVDNALAFINSRWNSGPSGTWYGNLDHPYAMWAVYKALEVYGFTEMNDNGTSGSYDDFLIGFGIFNAPGGITIGQEPAVQVSLAGDWYSHYMDLLVNRQYSNGSWDGYGYWTGALAAGWYINILNAPAGAVQLQRFEKVITDGPDEDLNGEIDLVVETAKPLPTAYEFTIRYTDRDRPEHVVILDTVPAEWEVIYAESTEALDEVEFYPANTKQPSKSATKIVWRPATVSSSLAVGVLSRERPSKKDPKFAPTSCGSLYLNDGAAAYEADPLTGMPALDAMGEWLPPIFGPTPPLCLAAVYDYNEDGVIVYDGTGDEDGDGLTDLQEACGTGTCPCSPDTDEDGLSDVVELELGTDPVNPDTDGDGLTDGEEVFLFQTDPLDSDTDDGGVSDGAEVVNMTNPLDGSDDFGL